MPLETTPTGYYQNFAVAVYSRVQEVQKMADPEWLRAQWETISSQLKVDKIYLESHRDRAFATDDELDQAKRFFEEQGVRAAGGIATVLNERGGFESFCYTDPDNRAYLKEIVERTARHFDEIILDDFFFNNTKRDSDIAAKGDRTWTQFRLDTMREVSQELVLKPAKAVNPHVKVVIKFPNWYEHFQGLGYDLDQEPKMFDAIYTGTETRQPVFNAQHLQQYESYAIIRYFENIAPGKNGGGWVDPFGMGYMDRYAEQLWLTVFAKAREITLFDFRSMLAPIRPDQRGAWQGQKTSFEFDKIAPIQPDGSIANSVTLARAAGAALAQVDSFLGKLGNPIGIKSYKPYQSSGEDFLHNYMGMIGIPMDIEPEFPIDTPAIFLTESAKFDPQIVQKIEKALVEGKRVTITSGLLRAIQDKGFQDIVEVRCSDRKTLTSDFYRRGAQWKAETPILLPQIEYYTNDSWELVGCGAHGSPLILHENYSRGELVVLAIPDNFGDLYALPPAVLDLVRENIMGDFFVRAQGPSQMALFAYDNDTFIIESFQPAGSLAGVSLAKKFTRLGDLVTGEEFMGEANGERMSFSFPVKAHSYLVFAALA